MNSHSLNCSALAAALLLAASAAAQTAGGSAAAPTAAPAAVASLDDAPGSPERLAQVALARDPGVRAALAGVDNARAGVDVADGALRPQLSYALGRFYNHLDNRTDGSGPPVLSNYSRRYGSESHLLSARQSLWAKADQAVVEGARRRVTETEAAVRQARSEVAVRIAEAWAEGLQAAVIVAQLEAQNALYAAQFEAAQVALRKGEGTRTDIEDAHARVKVGAAQMLQAVQMRQRAVFRLASLVGSVPEGLFTSAAGLEDAVVGEVGKVEEWIGRAHRGSPLVAIAASRLEQAQSATEASRARHLPTVSLVGQLSQGNSETVDRLGQRVRQATVGMQVNVPLYTGGTLDARERAAVADEARARETLDAQRLELRLKVLEQHNAVSDGHARIVALRQVVQSLQQLLVSMQQSRDAGVRSSLDVLAAQQRLAGGLRELRSTVIDTLLARLRLQALSDGLEPAALTALPGPRVASAN